MNFYASPGFLDAAASVWFKGRKVSIEDVKIGGDVLRLLVVDGRRIVTKLRFLDYHEPLTAAETEGPVRIGGYAQEVVRGVIRESEWDDAKYPGLTFAPYVDWSEFQSYEDYRVWLSKRSKSLIQDRERRWRKLGAEHGELVFTMNDMADDVFAFARYWKRRQLQETGATDYFATPQAMEFLELLQQRGLLASSTLRAGGRLAALSIGFVYDGVWSGWILTYDPAYRRYSVGHQLIRCMLEYSWRAGHRQFDFSVGAEGYKIVYATHGRLLGDIGRRPLAQSAVLFAKSTLRTQTPGLFEIARSAKREFRALRRRYWESPEAKAQPVAPAHDAAAGK